LLLETTREHLIGFIHDKDTKVVSLENIALHHIMDTAGSTNDNVDATLELLDVLLDTGATNTSMHVNAGILTDGLDYESNLHREFSGWCNDETLDV
jgi:hypothetical protein